MPEVSQGHPIAPRNEGLGDLAAELPADTREEMRLHGLTPRQFGKMVLVQSDSSDRTMVWGNTFGSLQSYRFIDENIVTGKTNLFLSTWSRALGFLHGADMMLPVCQLVEKLLTPDEHVVAIRQLRFNKKVSSNLDLTAAVEPSMSGMACFPGHVQAGFTTSAGRLITVRAEQNGDAITRFGYCNPLAKLMINRPGNFTQLRAGTDQFGFQCSADNDRNDIRKVRLSGVYLATLLDLITYPIVRAQESVLSAKGPVLLGGVENFTLPERSTFFERVRALKVKFQLDLAIAISSGFNLIPMEATFVDSDSGSLGGGICNILVPK